jgi:signal transduction histidine kinase
MSHELRTPLNAIGGYVDLMELGIRGPVTEAQLVDLQRMRRSKDVLLGLINDLLSFAKLEGGAVQYVITDVPVHEVLRQSTELLEPQLLAKGIVFVHEPVDAALRARGDADKLHQVVLNLLSNAIKFTSPGGLVTLACDADDAQVRVRVRDTGRGIPADRLTAIFDPFVQVGDRTSRDREGIGLGLAISRELTQGMGGTLEVASELGRGATFTVSLPRATDDTRRSGA